MNNNKNYAAKMVNLDTEFDGDEPINFLRELKSLQNLFLGQFNKL